MNINAEVINEGKILPEKEINDIDMCNKNVQRATSSNTSSFVNENNSILDFKSPKDEHLNRIKVFNHFPITKVKKKQLQIKVNNKSNNKRSNKQQRNKESSSHNAQTKINLLKSNEKPISENLLNDSKNAYVCPLCFKSMKDINTRTLHMKSCAIKNKIPTKKLLDALELQERQSAERMSLGLLPAPILQNRKPALPRKMGSHEDSQLQLALALSRSLHEANELKEWNEEETLPDLYPSEIPNTECKGGTLQNFGFKINDSAEYSNVISKKKRRPVTVLQTRSQEERERLLTQKIAEILMDSEKVIVKCSQINQNEAKKQINLKSQLLKQYLQLDNKLWNITKLMTNENVKFYVKELSAYIFPNENKKLQQNGNDDISKCVEEKFLLDNFRSPTDEKALFNKSPETHIKSNLSSTENEFNMNQMFVNTLITNWTNILNDSSVSDVIIFVNNGKHIWAHKLVFYVRCSNILLDTVTNDNLTYSVKEKICWIDINYYVALAFLEFIYCGLIKKYSDVLTESSNISSLQYLARKYKVQELFSYLRKVQFQEIKEQSNYKNFSEEIEHGTATEIDRFEQSEVTLNDNVKSCLPFSSDKYNTNIDNMNRTIKENQENILLSPVLNSNSINYINTSENKSPTEGIYHRSLKALEDNIEENTSNKIDCTMVSPVKERENNLSPDLFDDDNIDDTVINSIKNHIVSSTYHENCKSNTSLNMVHHASKDERILEDESTYITPSSKTVLTVVNEIETNLTSENKNIDTVLELATPCITDTSIMETPKFSISKCRTSIISDIKKQKSDLSLFIEKVQKYNAMSDSNLDSDTNSPFNISTKYNQNPFCIKQNNPDFHFVASDNVSSSQKEQSQKPSGLSILENDIKIHAVENPRLFNVTRNEYNRNSLPDISYQTELISSESTEELSDRDVNNSSTKYFSQSTTKNIENIQKNAINISSQSSNSEQREFTRDSSNSEDEIDISMYTKYKRKNKDNSIAMYRSAIKKYKVDVINKECLISNEINNFSSAKNHTSNNINKKRKSYEDPYLDTSSSNTDIEILDDIDKENTGDSTSQNGLELHSNLKISIVNTFSSSKKELKNLNTDMSSESSDEFVQNKRKNEISKNCDTLKDEVQLSYIHTDEIINNCVRLKDRNNSVVTQNWRKDINNENYKINAIDNNSSTDIKSYTKYTSQMSLKYGISSLSKTLKKYKKIRTRSKSEENLYFSNRSTEIFERKTTSNLFQQKSNCYGTALNGVQLITHKYNDISSPNYDTMEIPKLHEEMEKYGLKVQERQKAVKLLTYIYNELHPVVNSSKTLHTFRERSNSQDVGHDRQKYKTTVSSSKGIDNDYKNEISCSQNRKYSDKIQLCNATPITNCVNIREAFLKLLNTNKDIHNKILRYEPLNIKELHLLLKADGFKCKIIALMDFLDEQCINFHMPQSKNVKRRRIMTQ